MGKQAKVKVEIMVRTTAPDLLAGHGEVVKDQTLDELLASAYNWGQMDGKKRSQGEPYDFEGRGYSVGSMSLDKLRARFPNEGLEQPE